MKIQTTEILNLYSKNCDFIKDLNEEITIAFDMLISSFNNGGKLLVCGNGGSNSDADHIVGELLKGFQMKRPLTNDMKESFAQFGEEGILLADRLQDSLPAINLGAHTSLITAVINDIGGTEIYAQQVIGYGNKGDIFLGISTSGNSKNVINAAMSAKVKGLKCIALTGESGGRMRDIFDLTIKVPSNVTCFIQDMHTSIYHVLCAMVEAEMWDE